MLQEDASGAHPAVPHPRPAPKELPRPLPRCLLVARRVWGTSIMCSGATVGERALQVPGLSQEILSSWKDREIL